MLCKGNIGFGVLDMYTVTVHIDAMVCIKGVPMILFFLNHPSLLLHSYLLAQVYNPTSDS